MILIDGSYFSKNNTSKYYPVANIFLQGNVGRPNKKNIAPCYKKAFNKVIEEILPELYLNKLKANLDGCEVRVEIDIKVKGPSNIDVMTARQTQPTGKLVQ